MTISYIVAVKNGADTIGNCLKSLTNDKSSEVIVVDGNSTDGTSKIIDAFPVIHIYDEGKGPAAARKIGLEKCTGEYVVIIDCDQWVAEIFKEKLKQIIETKKSDVIFCTEIWSGTTFWAQAHQEEWTELSSLRRYWIYWPRIWKTSFLKDGKAWNENLGAFEDHDLWNRYKRKPNITIYHSNMVIHSDASHVSLLSEYKRGKWYGKSLLQYVKLYPSQWQRFLSMAPIGWGIDILVAARILFKKRKPRIALGVFLLRFSRSIGWLQGVVGSTRRNIRVA